MERFFDSIISLMEQTERRATLLLEVAPNLQPLPAHPLSDTEKYCREYARLGNDTDLGQLDVRAVMNAVKASLLADRALAEQHLQWTHGYDIVNECYSEPELLARLTFKGMLQPHNEVKFEPLKSSSWKLLIGQVKRIKSDLRKVEEMLRASAALPPEGLRNSLRCLHDLHSCLTRYQRLLRLFERDFQEWQTFHSQCQFALRELKRIAKASRSELAVGEEYFAAAVLVVARKILRAIKHCRDDLGGDYPKGQNLNYREELLKLFDTKSGAQELTNLFLHQWRLHREYQRALCREYGSLQNAYTIELPGLFVEALAPAPLHDDPFRFALDFEKIPASIKVIANQLRRLRHVQYESDSNLSALTLENAPSLSCGIQEWSAQEEARAKMREVFPKLTRREQEVVVLQSEGFSQRAIANALSISSGTVSVYLDRARKRAFGLLPPDRRWRKLNNLPQRKKS